MRQHCSKCRGKMRFNGMGTVFFETRARFYKCTKCGYEEWILCKVRNPKEKNNV